MKTQFPGKARSAQSAAPAQQSQSKYGPQENIPTEPGVQGMPISKRITNPGYTGELQDKAAYRSAKRGAQHHVQKEALYMAQLRGEVINPAEFQQGDPTWRMFRIMAEFVDGYDFLSKIRADVTIFGSARLQPNTPAYQQAYDLGRMLAESGFSVVTGGGPGIMEAANKGAFEADGESIGLNIQLPFEQRINPYVRHGIGFHYFFTRKVMLTSPSQAFVAFPGGLGTMDEVFEVLTLMQTGKMNHVPLILFGHDFWAPIVDYIQETLVNEYKTVSQEDMDLFTVVNTPEEAFAIIAHTVVPDEDIVNVHTLR